MTRLIQRFLMICLLRAGPQDLPDSPFLLALSFIAYLFAGLFLAGLQQPLAISLLLIAIDCALISILLYLLLWTRQLIPRYRRSLTAILGAGALLEIIAIPVIRWQQSNIAVAEVNNALLVSSLLLWVWLFWNVIVVGHILSQTLSTRFIVAMGLAIVYLYLSFNISRIVLGSVGG